MDESRDYEYQEIRENAHNRHNQQLILSLDREDNAYQGHDDGDKLDWVHLPGA